MFYKGSLALRSLIAYKDAVFKIYRLCEFMFYVTGRVVLIWTTQDDTNNYVYADEPSHLGLDSSNKISS